jgi:DNA gyrase/topoisomerase IV subunit A
LRVDEMPVQARGGAGVRVMRLDRKRGAVVAVAPVADRTLFVLDESTATVAATEIKLVARDAVGAAVPGVRPGAHVARVVASSAALDAD